MPNSIIPENLARGSVTADAIAAFLPAGGDKVLKWNSTLSSLEWADLAGESLDYSRISRTISDHVTITTNETTGSIEVKAGGITNIRLATGEFANITKVGNLSSLYVVGTIEVEGDVKTNSRTIFTPSAINLIDAGVGITASMIQKTLILVAGNGIPVVITADPPISAGINGQEIIIEGNTGGVNSVKFNPGSTLKLSGNVSFTVGNRDVLTLIYNSGDNAWHEKSRSDNY